MPTDEQRKMTVDHVCAQTTYLARPCGFSRSRAPGGGW
jgi:hypothetical protein